jgi:hypothetical protein
MAVKLNPECRKQLIDYVSDRLHDLSVESGVFLSGRVSVLLLGDIDKIIPQSGQLRQAIEEYVDHYPVFNFITDTINTDLLENHEFDSTKSPVPLSAFSNYSDARAKANELVSLFETLPWPYTYSVKLPAAFDHLTDRLDDIFELASGVRIIKSSKHLADNYPYNSNSQNRQDRIHSRGKSILSILQNSVTDWPEGSLFIQMETKGFCGAYGTCNPSRHIKFKLRSFFGLALAFQLCRYKRRFSNKTENSQILVHRMRGDQWEVDGKFQLEERYSRAIAELEFNDQNGDLKTTESKVNWAVACLNRIRIVFANADRAKKVLLAAQWFFDAHAINDEMLSFLQTVIVLEVLLGDKADSDDAGITTLLANRCAFMLAFNHAQREEILDDFKKIYRVRSKIVHGGKQQLTPDERTLFQTLNWMCGRVIRKEVELLAASN